MKLSPSCDQCRQGWTHTKFAGTGRVVLRNRQTTNTTTATKELVLKGAKMGQLIHHQDMDFCALVLVNVLFILAVAKMDFATVKGEFDLEL